MKGAGFSSAGRGKYIRWTFSKFDEEIKKVWKEATVFQKQQGKAGSCTYVVHLIPPQTLQMKWTHMNAWHLSGVDNNGIYIYEQTEDTWTKVYKNATGDEEANAESEESEEMSPESSPTKFTRPWKVSSHARDGKSVEMESLRLANAEESHSNRTNSSKKSTWRAQ